MIRDKIEGDKGQVYIDNKVYYYKRNDAYLEIFMQRIADFFQLHHAEYTPTTYKGLNYYLSEDLNNKGFFRTAYDAGIDTYDFNIILAIAKERFNDPTIIEDLYKMYFMDLMTLNIDRNNDNYGFLTKDDKTSLYVFDHGCCFLDYLCLLTSITNKLDNSSLQEIDYIIKNFDKEHFQLFLDMYNSLDINTFKKIITDTEDVINRDLPYKEYYISGYEFLRDRTLTRSKVLR